MFSKNVLAIVGVVFASLGGVFVAGYPQSAKGKHRPHSGAQVDTPAPTIDPGNVVAVVSLCVAGS